MVAMEKEATDVAGTTMVGMEMEAATALTMETLTSTLSHSRHRAGIVAMVAIATITATTDRLQLKQGHTA